MGGWVMGSSSGKQSEDLRRVYAALPRGSSRVDVQVGERRGGGAFKVLAIPPDQAEIAVGQVVAALTNAGARRERGKCFVRIESGADPALLRCSLGDDVSDRSDDVGVAEVQHPRGVDPGRVGADDVDVVVVGAGP